MATINRLIVGIILSFIFTVVNAQQRLLRGPSPQKLYQELQIQLNSTENPDSVIEFYTIYALNNKRLSPDSSEATIRKIKDLKGLTPQKREAYVSLIKAHLYLQPYPDSALIFVERSINFFDQENERKRIPGLLNLKSQIHGQLNNYLEAEEALLTAIDLVQNENQDYISIELNNLMNALAGIYMRVGAVEIAIKRYLQMLEIETSKDRECSIRLSISNAFKANNELIRAKEFLAPCLDDNAIPLPIRVAILKSYGNLEKLQGNNDERLIFIKQAIELQEQTRYRDITSYYFLAEAYFDKQEYEKSDSVLNLVSNKELRRVQPFTQINLRILDAKLLILKKEYNSALEVLNEAQLILKRLPETPLHVDVSILQADIYDKLGDHKKSYEIAKSIQLTNEVVTERAKVREEANSKVRFQMRAKNEELADVTTELGTVKTRNAIIIILLLMLTLYIIYRYRIHFLLKEERTRINIARDLHDDLSATLSSISFFSEAAKRDDSKGSKKFLQRIDESAVEAKEKINDIIWAIDPENDDWESFLTKCKRYAAEMFESKDIDYQIDIDTKIELPINIKARKDLWLVYKEIITNLVRHSESANAKVVFKSEKDRFIVTVEDDGIGFNAEENYKGNGLTNIKKRVLSISEKSNLILDSKPEEGTKWELVFVLG